jgi:hypothetical protein
MSPDAGGIMSVWQCASSASPLSSSEGELVSISISVDPRDLEELLEALAHIDFPINPQIYHAEAHSAEARTVVEFPAYASGLERVWAALAGSGFDTANIRVRGMLEEIQSLLGQEAERRDPKPA